MFKRIIISDHFQILFLIITELLLAALLKIDHSLTVIGISVVMIFWAALSHIFVKWLKFEHEFKELKESKSQTEMLLNEFAESNHLMSRIANTAKLDLKFDKNIKLNSEHKPFQLFLSALKYEYYLSSYFKYNQDENSPAITKIPRFYFEDYRRPDGEKHSIWMWLIEKSQRYKSIQVLNNDTSEIYLKNKERLETETNYLKNQFENPNAKLVSIQKLFVIKSEWLSQDGKTVINQDVITYLEVWKTRLSGMSKEKKKNLQVRFIKLSEAKGALNNSDYVDDIGIFDNILGIQKPEKTNSNLIDDSTDISFYFERSKVNNFKTKFDTIFNKAVTL